MSKIAEGERKASALRFDRALDKNFEDLIRGCRPLHEFLKAPGQLNLAHRLPVTFGTQFRRGNVVSICVGLTKVLELRWTGRDRLEATAHEEYTSQECARRLRVFGSVNRDELDHRVAVWRDYLGQVKVRKSLWHREGAGQGWLADQAFLGVPQPWTLIDREAELEGLVGDHLDALRASRTAIAAECLKNPLLQPRKNPIVKSRGGGIDFVGVTPEGNLALVEVKHASDAIGCYCTPIQVGGYAALWARALTAPAATKDVVKPIQNLLAQKRRLGFLPEQGPMLASAPRVEPSVVLAEPNFRSRLWSENGLLASVWAAACAAKNESAPRTRFFVCDTNTFTLREVTAELASGRRVLKL